MNIFLSWSKKRSNKVAREFYDWLPMVIQTLEPFLSPHIEKGIDPIEKIKETLEEFNFGIVCLTKENLDAPWIHFESGALSKFKQDARVWTFLLDVKPEDITGPLANYQHTRFEKEEVFRLLQSINQNNTVKLDEPILRRCFETSWPEMERKLLSIKTEGATEPAPSRNNLEITSEVLEIVRNQENTMQKMIRQYDELNRSVASLVNRDSRFTTISTPSILVDSSGNYLQQLTAATPNVKGFSLFQQNQSQQDSRSVITNPLFSSESTSHSLAQKIASDPRGQFGVTLGRPIEGITTGFSIPSTNSNNIVTSLSETIAVPKKKEEKKKEK